MSPDLTKVMSLISFKLLSNKLVAIFHLLSKFSYDSQFFTWCYSVLPFQKQPSRGVLRKRCSENMQQIYRRTPMPKCDFNEIALQVVLRCFIEITLWHGCSPVNLLHIFRTCLYKNTSGRLVASAIHM